MTPLRILVVEDDAIILMTLEMLLEDAGHEVVGLAMSARDAIDKALQLEPELVLLDVQLKDGSSGLDVARVLKARSNATVVFVTANPLKLDDEMEGAAAVIPKPFNERIMITALAYFEECLHRPPPHSQLPFGIHLAPAYEAAMSRQ